MSGLVRELQYPLGVIAIAEGRIGVEGMVSKDVRSECLKMMPLTLLFHPRARHLPSMLLGSSSIPSLRLFL